MDPSPFQRVPLFSVIMAQGALACDTVEVNFSFLFLPRGRVTFFATLFLLSDGFFKIKMPFSLCKYLFSHSILDKPLHFSTLSPALSLFPCSFFSPKTPERGC